MPFVAPKSSNSGTERATFRPPWVKEDGGASALKSTTVPWAKKNAATDKTDAKANGEKPATTTVGAKKTTAAADTKKVTETAPAAKKSFELPKKPVEVTKKSTEPAKKIIATKKTPEPATPAKKTIPTTAAAKTTTAAAKSAAAAKKKEPTPSSSEEETEEEETDEETEEETEEEEEEEEETDEEEEDEEDDDESSISAATQPFNQKLKHVPQKKTAKESESQKSFVVEKPQLRPVIKREKSLKKVEDDDEAEADETEEERERRLRFKLEKPKLRHVKREEKPLPSKSTDDIMKIRPVLKKVPKIDEFLKEPKEEPKPEFKTKTLRKASLKREPSIKNVPAPPPLPSLVPKAPPPPPPPIGANGEKQVLTEKQQATLDRLKTRPRRRPDWSEMMKEVEDGRKLRHVQCNDRSQPILTCKSMTKVDDKFIYETEKGNSHNKLLQQIQGGIKLKKTKTNDRSKPILEGLRKFRKQMTIEEQLQKSQSKVNMLGETLGSGSAGAGTDVSDGIQSSTSGIIKALSIEEVSGDELDDIDKIRDDLQSTKQMLALELRNREAQERENKKLLAKIAIVEAELEREKSREKNLEYGSNVIVATMDPTPAKEEIFVGRLKKEAEDARLTTKDLENKYHITSDLFDQAKIEIEEQKRQIQLLEKKLAQVLQGNITPSTPKPQFKFCYSYEDPDDNDTFYFWENTNGMSSNNGEGGSGSLNGSRRASDAHTGRDSSPDFEVELSESDPDEPEEKKQERRERRIGKEVKVLRKKLTNLKVKQEAAKKEKLALKQAMKKNHVILKEETKKFKKLEKEVHKMAASMKEDDEDEDDDDEEKEDEPEEEEEEEEEEESEESEESEEEAESGAETASESESEDALNSAKKTNLEPRVKKHEGRLSAMKKCNVLLQANVDNLQDEITQTRSKAANLQSELDAVLADLGF